MNIPRGILAVTTAGVLALTGCGASATDHSPAARAHKGGKPAVSRSVVMKPKPAAKPKAKATPHAKATDHPKPSPKPEPKPPKTYLVTRVIDGDTIELGNGETVRLVGIDTPEVGDCGADRATANTERLVLGKRVRLTISDEDRDRYGRLLRYVNLGNLDVGLRLIKNGNAIARYDSRDGYGHHPREERYIAADRASKNFSCPEPKPVHVAQAPSGGGCTPGYSPCLPPASDYDCAGGSGDGPKYATGPIRVTGSDPYDLDSEDDGVACES